MTKRIEPWVEYGYPEFEEIFKAQITAMCLFPNDDDKQRGIFSMALIDNLDPSIEEVPYSIVIDAIKYAKGGEQLDLAVQKLGKH